MSDPRHLDEVRRRQRTRALVTALILAGLVVLFFFVTLAKIGSMHGA